MLNGTCTVTFSMLMIALGSIAISLLFSKYRMAFMIGYFFSMYWAYTIYQGDLMRVFGTQTFLWSCVFVAGMATIFWVVTDLVQEGH